jgi:polygalacturonase
MPESVINVPDWGVTADWDGSTGTDNRAAIQAVIDEVTNPASVHVGKPNFLPRGRYWANWLDTGSDTHTFNVPDDLVVFGDGPDETLLHVGRTRRTTSTTSF